MKQKKATIHLCITQETKHLIRKEVAKDLLSISQWIEKVILKHLKKDKTL